MKEETIEKSMQSETEKINRQIEWLFSIDRHQNPALFKNESLKLVENLYTYIPMRWKRMKKAIEKYGVEFVEVGLSCIQTYNVEHESGANFITYFINAWKKTCHLNINVREIIDKKTGGLYVPERDKKALVKYYNRYKKASCGGSANDLNYEAVAEELGIPIDHVKDIIMLSDVNVERIVRNADGEEVYLFDLVPDKTLGQEMNMVEKANWEWCMKMIEKAYNALPRTPEPYVKDCFTCDLAKELIVLEEPYPYHYSFINEKLMKEMLESRKILLYKDIAQMHNVSKNTVSRAYNSTREKMRDIKKTFE